MTIDGYGYDFGLRAPIAYIRDDEGVCPVLVADLLSLDMTTAPGADTPEAVYANALLDPERTMTDGQHDSTRTADDTPCRADPEAEPQAGFMPRLAARLRRPVRREPRSSRPGGRHEDRSGSDGHPGSVVADSGAGGVPDGTGAVTVVLAGEGKPS